MSTHPLSRSFLASCALLSLLFLIAGRRVFLVSAFCGDFLAADVFLVGAFFGDFFLADVFLVGVFFGDFLVLADTFFFAGEVLADVFFLVTAFFADTFLFARARAELRFFALVSALALFMMSSSLRWLRCGNFARSPVSNNEGMVGCVFVFLTPAKKNIPKLSAQSYFVLPTLGDLYQRHAKDVDLVHVVHHVCLDRL